MRGPADYVSSCYPYNLPPAAVFFLSQKRYAALDAFVSYAAGVCVLLRPGKAPPLPVDLAAAPEWEVRLAAQWVAVQQYLEAQSPDRTKHDFYRAWFSTTKVSCT